MNSKLVLLLVKMDQLKYPAGELRGIGGVLMASFPLEYVDSLLNIRQALLDELQRERERNE